MQAIGGVKRKLDSSSATGVMCKCGEPARLKVFGGRLRWCCHFVDIDDTDIDHCDLNSESQPVASHSEQTLDIQSPQSVLKEEVLTLQRLVLKLASDLKKLETKINTKA